MAHHIIERSHPGLSRTTGQNTPSYCCLRAQLCPADCPKGRCGQDLRSGPGFEHRLLCAVSDLAARSISASPRPPRATRGGIRSHARGVLDLRFVPCGLHHHHAAHNACVPFKQHWAISQGHYRSVMKFFCVPIARSPTCNQISLASPRSQGHKADLSSRLCPPQYNCTGRGAR